MQHSALVATVTIALLPSLALGADYPGNLSLTSQTDVNAASIYTGVTGNLTISGTDIVDLAPLDGFTNVGGYITMNGNPSLTQVIDGFPNLTNVGGGLFFYNNDSLLSLSGFDALVQTGDNIDFWYNDVVTSVTGFASLVTAGWSLEFGGNPQLVEIPEFLSLQTISSSLYILDNPQLEAIDGFQALTYVDWSFEISGNTVLNDLCGLYNYFTLNNPYTGGGAFNISNNGPGLPNPTTEQDVINAGPCLFSVPFCFGDGLSGVDCPGGNLNNSAVGAEEGCVNGTGVGAKLTASGSASVSADSLVLTVQQAVPSEFGIFVQNIGLRPAPSPFYNGLLCLNSDAHLVRHYDPPAIQPTVTDGTGTGVNAQAMTIGDYLNDTQPGVTVYYQFWGRDNAGPAGTGANFSSGLAVTWW